MLDQKTIDRLWDTDRAQLAKIIREEDFIYTFSALDSQRLREIRHDEMNTEKSIFDEDDSVLKNADVIRILTDMLNQRGELLRLENVKEGVKVKVVSATDETTNMEWIGRECTITKIEFNHGCGQAEGDKKYFDPMISVVDMDGNTEQFWLEELQPVR